MDGGRNREPSGRAEALALAGVLLLALVLRLYRIGAESLWMDEVFSLRDARWPPLGPNLVRPVYYALLHVWLLFGSSDAWARALAAAFGVAGVWATWRLGRTVAGPLAGLVAGVLCALSPLEIDHAQEIRMYTAASFFALLGSQAALALRGRPTGGRVSGWLGLRALAVLTSPFAALLLPVDAALLRRVPRARLFSLVIGVASLGVAVFLLRFPDALLFPLPWIGVVARPTPPALVRPLLSFTAWWPTQYWQAFPRFAGTLAVLHAAYLATAAALVAGALASRRDGLGAVAGWAFVPLGLLAAGSFLSGSLWLDRFLMIAAPYLLILLGAGWSRAWRLRRSLGLAAAALYLAAVGLALVSLYGGGRREDFRRVAFTVQALWRPGDALAVDHPALTAALAHYAALPAPPVVLDLPREPPEGSAVARRILTPLRGSSGRVLLVAWLAGERDRHATLRGLLSRVYRIEADLPFTGLELFVLAREGPPAR